MKQGERETRPYLESSQDNLSVAEKAKNMTYMEVLLQDSLDNKQPSTIYLINGIKLEGYVMAFDHETIVYRRDAGAKPFGVSRAAVASFLPEGASLSRDIDRHRHAGPSHAGATSAAR